ncbi:ABC transporter permease, partial [Sphingomonas sp. GC_Shp_4]
MSSAWLTLYRSLTRHRLYAILNIGGLALGIAVFLVLLLFVRFERSYDRWLPGVERLYLVEQTFHFANVPETPVVATMAALLEQLREEEPGLRGTRIWSMGANVRHGAGATAEKLALVDPSFFALFRYRFLAGDPRSALADPDGIVLGRAAAERYFAPGRALGSTMTLVIDGKTYSYRVTGVVADAPVNTSIAMTMMAPLVA